MSQLSTRPPPQVHFTHHNRHLLPSLLDQGCLQARQHLLPEPPPAPAASQTSHHHSHLLPLLRDAHQHCRPIQPQLLLHAGINALPLSPPSSPAPAVPENPPHSPPRAPPPLAQRCLLALPARSASAAPVCPYRCASAPEEHWRSGLAGAPRGCARNGSPQQPCEETLPQQTVSYGRVVEQQRASNEHQSTVPDTPPAPFTRSLSWRQAT
jgi:hypothetical protein